MRSVGIGATAPRGSAGGWAGGNRQPWGVSTLGVVGAGRASVRETALEP